MLFFVSFVYELYIQLHISNFTILKPEETRGVCNKQLLENG